MGRKSIQKSLGEKVHLKGKKMKVMKKEVSKEAKHKEPSKPRIKDADQEEPARIHLCDICGAGFKTQPLMKRHQRIHSDIKPHACQECPKAFRTLSRLKDHMRSHTKEKPVKCETCGIGLASTGALLLHKRIHTGEKPHSCQMCQKAFTTKGQLQRHERIHTGQRPYMCKVCSNTFCDTGALKTHMRLHTGEKPFSCEVCGKKFTVKCALKSHFRLHTGERPYVCDMCGNSYTASSQLSAHKMRAHLREKAYSCQVCGLGYTKTKYLKAHMARSHAGHEAGFLSTSRKYRRSDGFSVSGCSTDLGTDARYNVVFVPMEESLAAGQVGGSPTEAATRGLPTNQGVHDVNSTCLQTAKTSVFTERGHTGCLPQAPVPSVHSGLMEATSVDRGVTLAHKHDIFSVLNPDVQTSTGTVYNTGGCMQKGVKGNADDINANFAYGPDMTNSNYGVNYTGQNSNAQNAPTFMSYHPEYHGKSKTSDIPSNDNDPSIEKGRKCNEKDRGDSYTDRSDMPVFPELVKYYVNMCNNGHDQNNLNVSDGDTHRQGNMVNIPGKENIQSCMLDSVKLEEEEKTTKQRSDSVKRREIMNLTNQQKMEQNEMALQGTSVCEFEKSTEGNSLQSQISADRHSLQSQNSTDSSSLQIHDYSHDGNDSGEGDDFLEREDVEEGDNSMQGAYSVTPLVHAATGAVNSTGDSMHRGINDDSADSDSTEPPSLVIKLKSDKPVSRSKGACVKSFLCEICAASFSSKSYLKAHMRSHTGETPFQCRHCPSAFSKSVHLKHHMRTHTGETPYVCDICGARLSSSGALAAHKRVHAGDRPFACSKCQKRFTTAGQLNRHERIHTGARPYACKLCKATFADTSALKTHIRLHTGEKPFACDVCEKRFTVKSALTSHARIHTGERPYICSTCGLGYTTACHLAAHRNRAHIGKKAFNCPVCGVGYTKTKYVKAHMERCHPEHSVP